MNAKQIKTVSEAKTQIWKLVQSNFVPAQANGVAIFGHVQISSRSKVWMHLVSVRPEDKDRAVEFLRVNFSFLSNVQYGE